MTFRHTRIESGDADAGVRKTVLGVDDFSDHATPREYCAQRCLGGEDGYGRGGGGGPLDSVEPALQDSGPST